MSDDIAERFDDRVMQRSAASIGLLIIASGLVTSAMALGLVYALGRADFSVMMFYLNYVIPIGAILVGLAAGSGYAVATWLQNIKITAAACWLIVILQLGSYLVAEYIGFAHARATHEDGRLMGFWEYFDAVTRSFAWKGDDGKLGNPLGAWGYGLRALEVSGFVFGGLLGALILRAKPYCEGCRRYMKTQKLGFIAASVPKRKVHKKDIEAVRQYQEEQDQAQLRAQVAVDELAAAAAADDGDRFVQILGTMAVTPKVNKKLSSSYSLEVVHCPACAGGYLKASSVSGQGDKMKVTETGRWDLSPAFVASMNASAAGVSAG